jgi:hypothetical protein
MRRLNPVYVLLTTIALTTAGCVAAPEESDDVSEENVAEENVAEIESAINPMDATCYYYSDATYTELVGFTHWNCTLNPFNWGTRTYYADCVIWGACE